MADQRLNDLLKWGIENSETAREASDNPPRPGDPRQGINADALAALLGGPTDADHMLNAMNAVTSPEVDLENKLTAFDNFNMLIEDLNNANNMENLSLQAENKEKRGLWVPLLEQLKHDDAEMRRMAAWCIGTAVQNNEKTQKKLHELDGIPHLVTLSTSDSNSKVRERAIKSLSSAIRNYPPALDTTMEHLPTDWKTTGAVDANDMDTVDNLIDSMKQRSRKLDETQS